MTTAVLSITKTECYSTLNVTKNCFCLQSKNPKGFNWNHIKLIKKNSFEKYFSEQLIYQNNLSNMALFSFVSNNEILSTCFSILEYYFDIET